MRRFILLIIIVFESASSGAGLPKVDSDWMFEKNLGGETTYIISQPSVLAFQNPLVNLDQQKLNLHLEGDVLFERKFSDDPGHFQSGLGPVYNNVSCAACHIRDGRGSLAVVDSSNPWTKISSGASVFLRISIENNNQEKINFLTNQAPAPVPGFSTQLFHLGSFRLREDAPGTGQAEVWMKYEYSKFIYPDGLAVSLRKPIFQIRNPYDLTSAGSSRLFAADVRTSPRMTPPMIGLGLIEAIREQDIRNLATRDLKDWGIQGYANEVLDRQKILNGDSNPWSMGRFGLKANTPSVFHQSLGALNGDMGVTNPAFQIESIFGTVLFDKFLQYWTPGIEADQKTSDALVFYSQTLAVPSRRNVNNPEVLAGAQLFEKAGCIYCHHPSYKTGSHVIAELGHQKIYPFSDFLLHDMGEGLADGRQDFLADGRSWKTRPLWGLGLTQVINPRAGYMHDGRARTLEEAILWHDGEAKRSREEFSKLNFNERDFLIQFLKSL